MSSSFRCTYSCQIVLSDTVVEGKCIFGYQALNKDRKKVILSLIVEYQLENSFSSLELIQKCFNLSLSAENVKLFVISKDPFYESFSLQFNSVDYQAFCQDIPIARQFCSISASSFYSSSSIVSKENVDDTVEKLSREEVFDIFPKQLMSFHRFDCLIKASPCSSAVDASDTSCSSYYKLFSFESLQSGKRSFVVGSLSKFYSLYFDLPLHHRHVYEIIRHSFPCRLYFDLEYLVPYNPLMDGNLLTKKFISLIFWKFYSLFHLCLDWKNVLVLDSTTDEKFSKHLIFHIYDSSSTRNDSNRCLNESFPPPNEYLFPDNISISSFVQMILDDVMEVESCSRNVDDNEKPDRRSYGMYESYEMNDDITQDRRLSVATPVIVKPKKEFEDFWVFNEHNERKLFVDLGVYTRNRAFRCYGSCKYGKKKSLTLSLNDKQFYNFQSLDSLKSSTTLSPSSSVNIHELRIQLLNDSFVIPHDLLLMSVAASASSDSSSSVIGEHVSSSEKEKRFKDTLCSEENLLDFSSFIQYFNSKKYRIIPVSEFSTSYSRVSQSSYPLSSLPSFPSFSSSSSTNSIKNILLKSSFSRQESPFPLLDQYLTSTIARKGGIDGILSEWFISWKANGDFPIYKIRYQVNKNRFCENVQRMHKSNGIFYEINLMTKEFFQCCWDPDCKGFSSNPVILPEQVIPSPSMVMEKIKEKIKR
jgi:hypothetical protein